MSAALGKVHDYPLATRNTMGFAVAGIELVTSWQSKYLS